MLRKVILSVDRERFRESSGEDTIRDEYVYKLRQAFE